ncbi:hypothetical protein [Kitasatospora sp. NPDC002965]|uniref:hypothetical protein n=1 Tax=Kitasatospora sp. NPDC002965 TaxID=3154775 RepID=UPI0033AAA79B
MSNWPTNLLAEDPPKPGLIPAAKPTKIPGLDGPVGTLMGYGLYLIVLAGVAGVGYGIYKLVMSDKSRHGGGSEPFKWIGSGVAAILLSGSLIAILNGIAG